MESSRKSKFMTGLKVTHKQRVDPVEAVTNIDSNSIKLLRGPLSHHRDLPVKEGKLILYGNSVWCFGFGSSQERVDCVLARNILSIYEPSGRKHLCFDTTNVTLLLMGSTEF